MLPTAQFLDHGYPVPSTDIHGLYLATQIVEIFHLRNNLFVRLIIMMDATWKISVVGL